MERFGDDSLTAVLMKGHAVGEPMSGPPVVMFVVKGLSLCLLQGLRTFETEKQQRLSEQRVMAIFVRNISRDQHTHTHTNPQIV